MTRRHRATTGAILICSILTPLAARAWSSGADFETRVHGHGFSRVDLDSSQCQLKVRLSFDAPADGYKHEVPARNVYRFHARIEFDDGRKLMTRLFTNSAPGLRTYTYTVDSTPEGCWAKSERKMRGIDVEGCRGAGCKPAAFE